MGAKIYSINRLYVFLLVLFFVMSWIVSTPRSTDAATEKPIIIGVSLSLTGQFNRESQDHLRGWKMWIDDVNRRGGLLGRKVEIKVYDDRSDPSTSVKLYEKLITDDKVDLLVGPYSSAITMASTTVAEKYKFAVIAPGASSTLIWERGYKYCFQMNTPARFQLRPLVVMAKEKGYKTVAIVGVDSAFPKDLIIGAVKACEDLGLEVVLREEYPLKVMDLSSLLYKIKAASPDVFIGCSYLPDSILITRQAKEAGFVPKMFAFGPIGPSEPEFLKSLGKDADYILGVSQWEPTAKYPGSPEFVKVFKGRYSDEPSYNNSTTYGAGQILEEAVKRAGSLEQDKLRDAMAQMDIVTVFGNYKVDQTGLQVAHETVIVQSINGQKKVVGPEKVKEANAVLPFPGWR